MGNSHSTELIVSQLTKTVMKTIIDSKNKKGDRELHHEEEEKVLTLGNTSTRETYLPEGKRSTSALGKTFNTTVS